MKTHTILQITAVYLIGFSVSYTALTAKFNHERVTRTTCNEDTILEDRSFTAFIAAIPVVGWGASFFQTHFYHYGFTWHQSPCPDK